MCMSSLVHAVTQTLTSRFRLGAVCLDLMNPWEYEHGVCYFDDNAAMATNQNDLIQARYPAKVHGCIT